MSQKLRTIKIERAEYFEAYKLKLFFSDGAKQIVDSGPFLKNSLHPEIRKYLSLRKFKKFAVDNGDLMWGDFDLIFPMIDLYENKLDPEVKVIGKPRSSLNTH